MKPRVPRPHLIRSGLRAGLLAGLLAALLVGLPGLAAAQPALKAPAGKADAPLPAEVEAALAQARLPRDSLSVFVADLGPTPTPRLAWRAGERVNPASVMKLVTTYAALDLLGPAYVWRTPVLLDGAVEGGVLHGNLVLRGQGDPRLVVERLWLALRRVQAMGVRRIAGDIVLDRSAFDVPAQNPADFDGEPNRPYNAQPDALLLNFKSVLLTLSPDAARDRAVVSVEPPLAGVRWPATVPLVPGGCGDWRAALKLDLSDPALPRLDGGLPRDCPGERVWPIAYAQPERFAARLVEGLWRDIGGVLDGQARDGRAQAPVQVQVQAPAQAAGSEARQGFELVSPALSEVVRDVNKYSNNVMAQQIFLTLSLQARGRGTLEGSREVLRDWWRERFGALDQPVMDNGSGLSRDSRISAQALATMLRSAWASPVMPELMASLPISGVDGTLRRAQAATGVAHLKTGSLRDVAGVAGYVLGASGQRHVLVAIVNHPRAASARPVLAALIDWTARDR